MAYFSTFEPGSKCVEYFTIFFQAKAFLLSCTAQGEFIDYGFYKNTNQLELFSSFVTSIQTYTTTC